MSEYDPSKVNVRLSVAIPSGMIIWTNYGAVTGVRMPGDGIVVPRAFDLVHFSAADFPHGIKGENHDR